MQNLMKKPMLSNSSDFSMQLEAGKKAILEVLGYALRLTKAGKLAFPNLSQGNLSEADIATVKTVCEATDKPFSGKGGMCYQVTAFKNSLDSHEFINSFNPNSEAGEIIEVEAYQRKDAEGKLSTYTGTDGTVYPSISIRIAKQGAEDTPEVANTELAGVEADIVSK